MLIFKGCRLARMSSGRYCVIKDLGPVKGGKGMKHHEVFLTLTPKGLMAFCIGVARGLSAHFARSVLRGSTESQRMR
jgi:hypothetical protein